MNTGIAVWASIALNAEYFTCLLSTRLNVYSFTCVWMCRALTTYDCVCDCVMCVHGACMHPYISSWTEHSLYHILKRAKICTTAPDLFWHWWQSYSAVLVVGGFVMDMTEAQILPIEGSGIAKVCLQTILSLSLSPPLSLWKCVRVSLFLSQTLCLSVALETPLSFSSCISIVSVRRCHSWCLPFVQTYMDCDVVITTLFTIDLVLNVFSHRCCFCLSISIANVDTQGLAWFVNVQRRS
jgi:hypothetical protein